MIHTNHVSHTNHIAGQEVRPSPFRYKDGSQFSILRHVSAVASSRLTTSDGFAATSRNERSGYSRSCLNADRVINIQVSYNSQEGRITSSQ